MIPPKDKAPRSHPRSSKPKLHTNNSNTPIRNVPFAQRKKKGQVTMSESFFLWRSKRAPSGNYKTPLPEDLI